MVLESPARITEHKVARQVDAQRASDFYAKVATRLGIDIKGKKAQEERRVEIDTDGRIVARLHCAYRPRGEGVYALTYIRLDQYAAIIIPTQSVGMDIPGGTSVVFLNKTVLRSSEESYARATGAVNAALESGRLQP